MLARELLASRHDFIIARIPDDLNPRLFESKVIGIEKACLIVRRGHPLIGRSPVPLDRLAAHDWVFQPGGTLLRRTDRGHFPRPQCRAPGAHPQHHLAAVDAGDGGAVRRHRPGFRCEVARFIQSDTGLAGAIEILPVDFEIVVQPYSLITAKNRTAVAVGAAALRRDRGEHRRASLRDGSRAAVVAGVVAAGPTGTAAATSCHIGHFASEAPGCGLNPRIRLAE